MLYPKRFYKQLGCKSLKSAREVVPLIINMVHPKSVADVGCGVGSWLSMFLELGIDDVQGFDTDWVPKHMLQIPMERFCEVDLKNPLKVSRTFDLAISLEVGEHLVSSSADVLVDSLVSLAPIVVFSAAIPLQGGHDHVNEQWQGYWAQRFSKRGYVAIDAIRPQIWQNENVAGWYRQNILMYVKQSKLDDWPVLSEIRSRTNEQMLSIVHPYLLEQRNRQPLGSLTQIIAWRMRERLGRIKRAFMRR